MAKLRLSEDSKLTLARLAKAGKISLEPDMKIIGDSYRREVGAIFEKKQPRGVGGRWQPLSEPYGSWKAKKYPSAPMLVITGALKDSMTKKGAAGNINLVGKFSGVFGSTVDYGIYHDEGTDKIPKRNFSKPSKRRVGTWLQQVEDSIIANFRLNGIQVNSL